jgi:hypothetical protein
VGKERGGEREREREREKGRTATEQTMIRYDTIRDDDGIGISPL